MVLVVFHMFVERVVYMIVYVAINIERSDVEMNVDFIETYGALVLV